MVLILRNTAVARVHLIAQTNRDETLIYILQ